MMGRVKVSLRLLTVGICGLAMLAVAPVRGQTSAADPRFRFVLLGDPQVGYGSGGEAASQHRLIELLTHVRQLDPALIINPGDMVHAGRPIQWRLYNEALARSGLSFISTPGNHDMEVDAPWQRQQYLQQYGPDHYDFVYQDCAFVVINSEVMRDMRLSGDAYAEQWLWLELALKRHSRAGRRHIFLILHRPPFVDQPDEKEAYANWPPAARRQLMELIARHGIKVLLCGHLHQTREIVCSNPPFTAYTVGGTSRLWDKQGFGYRIFSVDGDAVDQRFVQLDLSWPPLLGVLGISGWVPRAVRPQWAPWLATLALAITTSIAFMRARRAGRSRCGWKSMVQRWALPALLLLFTLDTQLQFGMALNAIGMTLDFSTSLLDGWGTLLVLIAITVTLVLLLSAGRLWMRRGDAGYRVLLLLSLIAPAGMFLVGLSHLRKPVMLSEQPWPWIMVAASGLLAAWTCWSQPDPMPTTGKMNTPTAVPPPGAAEPDPGRRPTRRPGLRARHEAMINGREIFK